jgi:hypothetical protein
MTSIKIIQKKKKKKKFKSLKTFFSKKKKKKFQKNERKTSFENFSQLNSEYR